ncbi:uncharacterized protein LOC136071792 [Hydra vulgaris]|uniref:Uncharacterized protein LOC136071792 n=1 Tax=Hydra vulgaris TaxID=6087 RepID=A0ABM4BVD4_HYDVU
MVNYRQPFLTLFFIILPASFVSCFDKINEERSQEAIAALVKFTEILSESEDQSSGSGDRINDGLFHNFNATFVVLPKQSTHIKNIENSNKTLNIRHLSNSKVDSKENKSEDSESKESSEFKNKTLNTLIEAFNTGLHKEQSNHSIDEAFHSVNHSSREHLGESKLKSHRNSLEVTKLIYQPTHSNHDNNKNKDIRVGFVKYNHKKRNKPVKKSHKGVLNSLHKSFVSYYKILTPLSQTRIENAKIRDLNRLLDKTHNQTEKDSNSTVKDTNKNTSNDIFKEHDVKTQLRNQQDDYAKSLQKSLEDVRFKNGATGKVKAGQEFAYISQCGLYTEPQNISTVQHSWVTKTYSPYFYLYEKPKKYEKCKPSAWLNGTDLRGSVFLSFEVKSLHGSTMENNAKICEKYCCKEPRCAAWVLRIQNVATSNCPANSYCCWLKTDVPHPEPREDCVSGKVHRDHYRHPPVGMRSSIPLGGLGSGSFEMRTDGTFHEWTIENQSPGGAAKLSKSSLEMLLLGVRVQKGKLPPTASVLRTHAPHGFDGVYSQTYSGSYPVSKLEIELNKASKDDVKLNLYAFSTFHPRNPKKAATPSVAFVLHITNPHSEEVDISFMINLPFGYHEDTIRRGNNFAEVAFTRLVTAADCQNACAKKEKCMAWTTNGPFSCMLKDNMPLHSYEYGIISGLKGEWSTNEKMLRCKRPGTSPQSGDISLYPLNHGSEINSFAVADDPEVVWNNFKQTGAVANESNVNVTGLNGAVSTRTILKPNETKLLTIVFAWHFPNRDIADERVGNFYNNLFKSSEEVAKATEKDLKEAIENVIKWQAAIMPPESLRAKQEERKIRKKIKAKPTLCNGTMNGVNVFPDCLQDILINSLSTLRSGMWMENGRWRQWEAYDCANMDPVHVDFHRILPYLIFYPALAKEVMLAWADHQLSNGMIQESLSMGCLEETSKEGVAGGRMMSDVNVGFIVQALLMYKWSNDTVFFDEIYPFTVRAMNWLMQDATKGTGLPYRKPDTYDLFDLEKYDHCAYNSISYLLALHAMKSMASMQKDNNTINNVNAALSRATKQLEVEMWNEKKGFYHAWFDDEWGSPTWLMSDVLYGQVWAYTLGLGDLLDRDKMKKHLKTEEERNDTPFGLKVLSKSESSVPTEDTSVILGDELNSCKSLENITKTESVWMSSSSDWTVLQLYLGMEPHLALEQVIKSLDNYRTTLRDQWNFHGLTSSQHYGLDGLPWATSHYTFHLVLWHLPLALSGQQYNAISGTLTFEPKYDAPYWLPFYTPLCMGNIEAKEQDSLGSNEILYRFTVTSGQCNLNELSISNSKYSKNTLSIHEGESVEWSAPKKSKKEIVSDILAQLKH